MGETGRIEGESPPRFRKLSYPFRKKGGQLEIVS